MFCRLHMKQFYLSEWTLKKLTREQQLIIKASSLQKHNSAGTLYHYTNK